MNKLPIIRSNRELTTHLKKLNMTNQEFANMIGYSTAAFKKWGKDSVPSWIPFVIGYLQTLKHNEDIAIELGISSCNKNKKISKR